MKIAFLNIYNGVIERGSEVFVDELANKLSSRHQIYVFQTGKKVKKQYHIVTIVGIPVVGHGIIYDLAVLLFTLKCLPTIFRQKFDWIVPINGRWQILICRMLKLFLKFKIMISAQAGIGFDDKFNLLVGQPDAFVALSSNAYTWAKSIYNGQKITYIPNGINLNKFHPAVKKAIIILKRPVVLCVAALLEYKRINNLILAIQKTGNLSLLLIGDGPQKQIIDLGHRLLKDRFSYINKISQDSIPSYFAAADLFSLPSRESEAFGIVYLEALASNLPVVAPADENRRQIIGNSGFYCNVENIEEYAKTLIKAIKSKKSNLPRQQAEKFSWYKVALSYEKVFNET